MTEVGVAVIGGGLMGRELLSTAGRWPSLNEDVPRPVLRAACDLDPRVRDWFSTASASITVTDDYRRILDDPKVQVVYIAVPHQLHEEVYIAAAEAGKDFLGEKPFGIDLAASQRIVETLQAHPGRFVRVSSEMPFFPGAQRAIEAVQRGDVGDLLEIEMRLDHSSDLDRNKKINWKRQSATCGPGGVMADLGIHVFHLPVRLGLLPSSLYAVLSDVVSERAGADGEMVPCDTYDNATLLGRVDRGYAIPETLRMRRIAPGQSNTWRFTAIGMDGGVDFSSRYPCVVRRFQVRDGAQGWVEEHTGTASVIPTATPAIAEFGFNDAILQMWAAFMSEREGSLRGRFGCARPDEALTAHHLTTAALDSHARGIAVDVAAASNERP